MVGFLSASQKPPSYRKPMSATRIHIPQPCSVAWATMTPTANGRHCAACQTEVVDFTHMSEDEVRAYLAAHRGARVCGLLAAPKTVPRHYKRRRPLLAVAALFGWQLAASCAGKPPQRLPAVTVAVVSAAPQITIRGQVVDDSLHGSQPRGGIYVFVGGTKYGAITDAQGNFVLTFDEAGPLVIDRKVKLYIPPVAFATQDEQLTVNLEEHATELPAVLIRLRSIAERGLVKGKAILVQPPVPLSKMKSSGKRK